MNTSVHRLTRIAIMAAVTAVLAPLSIPVGEVPVSAATLAVMLGGLVLGKTEGAASAAVYLLLGAAGIPVFAGYTGGLSILLGVTGGYLLCYPVLAWICGRLDELLEKKGMAVSFAMITAMAAGTAVLYACGTVWFVILTRMQFTAALAVCVIPFLPGDLLKMAVCVLIVPQIRKALEARR